MRRMAVVGLILAVCAIVAGCRSGKWNTKGVVLKDGAPLKTAQDDVVRVVLVPLPEDGSKPQDYYVAEFNSGNSTIHAARCLR